MAVPEILRKLLTAAGPSGYEQAPAAVFRQAAGAFAEVTHDSVGSTVAKVSGISTHPGRRSVAIVGHVDEIGLIVHHIDDDGYLWFTGVGGWDPVILVGQRVEIATRDGLVLGVVGKKPIHLLKTEEDRRKAPELKGLHIDIGAADRDRALELIRIGDPVVIAADPVRLDGSRLVSRSMDNRLGAYVALESLRRVHERGNLKGRMAAVASVEEEIGLKGALTSSFKVRPDVALAIDVTHATDAPGLNEKELGSHEFGSGPAIGRGSTLSPQVFELLCAAAEGAGIAYTIEAHGRATGTDAGSIHISREGIPTGDLGIPLRYMHSPVEMVDLGDLEAVVELVVAFAEALDETTDLTR